MKNNELKSIALRCISCKKTFNLERTKYFCDCGSLLEVAHDLKNLEKKISKKLFEKRHKNLRFPYNSGVWRYKELILPIDDKFIISRPEGNTNIYENKKIRGHVNFKNLYLKHEGENPTGSFKDRGMTVGVSIANFLGKKVVGCASTGNTSASLASYSALANMSCIVFIPKGEIAFGKLSQVIAYGAKTIQIEGDFDDAMKLIKETSEEVGIYILNSINPFRIEGQKSIIFELLQQRNWQVPDWIVVPGGNLGNISAFGKAIYELRELDFIDKIPRFAVVQAKGANPFYLSFKKKFSKKFKVRADTIASAIKIGNPVNYAKAKNAIEFSNGIVEQVSDQEIMDAKAIVDNSGIGAEPASCATVAGIKKLNELGTFDKSDVVIGILTGNLLKDSDNVLNYHIGKLKNKGIKSNFGNMPISIQAKKEIIMKYLSNEFK